MVEYFRPSGGGRREAIPLFGYKDGETVLGTLELKGKALLVSVNSARRAETIKALVIKAVGETLKPPLTSIRTV